MVVALFSDRGVAGSHRAGSAMNLESTFGLRAPDGGLMGRVADIGLRREETMRP